MAALFFAFFLFAFALIYRFTSNWASISRIHAFIWTCFFLGYSLFGDKSLSFVGPLWIFSSLFMVFIGEKIGLKSHVPERTAIARYPSGNIASGEVNSLPMIYWLCLILISCFSVLGGFLKMRVFGYDIRVFFNFSDFLKMNSDFSKDRYSEVSAIPFWINLLSLFQYVCVLLGSYSFFFSTKTYQRVICFLCFFPVLFNCLIDTTKAGLIAAFFLLICGLLTGVLFVKKRMPKIPLKYYFLIIGLALMLLGVLFLLMVNRAGGFTAENVGFVKKKFSIYAFGEIGAFDEWLRHYYSFGSYTFGKMTFLGPLSLLGFAKRATGVYAYLPGFETNVFTSFRGLISDFGLFGGLLALGFLGFFSGLSLRCFQKNAHPFFSRIAYSQTLFFILYSFLISPWTYSSFVFTFIFFWLACVAQFYFEKYNKRLGFFGKS